jgi:hypothetical protein
MIQTRCIEPSGTSYPVEGRHFPDEHCEKLNFVISLQFQIYENRTVTASIPIVELIFQRVEFKVDKNILEYKSKEGNV